MYLNILLKDSQAISCLYSRYQTPEVDNPLFGPKPIGEEPTGYSVQIIDVSESTLDDNGEVTKATLLKTNKGDYVAVVHGSVTPMPEIRKLLMPNVGLTETHILIRDGRV